MPSGLKRSTIQDQQVRVAAKSRDELQAVIAAVRVKDFPVALQFTNFRDWDSAAKPVGIGLPQREQLAKRM